jgi:hypothetical protein
MANDFIQINTSNPAAASQAMMLKSYVSSLRSAYETGQRVRSMMLHMHDGVDFSELEKQFGLPAGEGQIVFDLVNGSIGAMDGTFQNFDCITITEKVG